MILFDFSQIIHNNIYTLKQDIIKDGIDKNINFLKHRILTHILFVAKKYKKHREIILCADSKNNWRKDIHPYYKARRKLRRKDDGFPWNEFWGYMDEFEKELMDLFPFNFIKIDRAEGDDVIGTLTYYFYRTRPNEDIIIASNDKDFKQLQFDSRVKLYNHKDKKEIKTLNYKNELMWLILKGDDGDDVLNVKTTDLDTFINPDKKQITMWRSDKIWEHITNNSVKDELLVDLYRKNKETKKMDLVISKEDLLKNFDRNRQLVDLRKTPKQIKVDILELYERNRKEISKKGELQLLQYFISRDMRTLTSRIEDFNKFFKFDDNIEDGGIMSFLKNR